MLRRGFDHRLHALSQICLHQAIRKAEAQTEGNFKTASEPTGSLTYFVLAWEPSSYDPIERYLTWEPSGSTLYADLPEVVFRFKKLNQEIRPSNPFLHQNCQKSDFPLTMKCSKLAIL